MLITVVLGAMPLFLLIALRANSLQVAGCFALIGMGGLGVILGGVDDASVDLLLEAQVFFVSLIACCLVLRGIRNQELRVRADLRREREVLDARVEDRTRELREARQRAVEADEAKSKFLAKTSHEIRTSLNAIMGMTRLLSEGPLTEDSQDQMSIVLGAGASLTALLNDVLDLSKIEAGRLEIARRPARIRPLFDNFGQLWRPRAVEKGIDLRIDVGRDRALREPRSGRASRGALIRSHDGTIGPGSCVRRGGSCPKA